MHVYLVSMPWPLLELPSLALGTLRARINQTRPADKVTELHASLVWAEFLLDASGGELTPADYTRIAQNISYGLGDWIFAGTLTAGNEQARVDEFRTYLKETDSGIIAAATQMRGLAEPFIDSMVREIISAQPDVVAFTSTFMQNVPSLSAAKRIKAAHPAAKIVFGGANCDGPMGASLHSNYDFVDYVVRGEGERAFPALLECIASNREPDGVPGVCWRQEGTSVANAEASTTVPPADIPMPDFDGWYGALEVSAIRPYLEPMLALEGARGCWWGEKHQCTFCGLNGSTIAFRSKSPDKLLQEITELVTRYQMLDIVMVDNIIDMSYFKELLGKLADNDWDMRIHYEVKSNLTPEQVRILAAAHVVHIQPGIENLSTRVLGLMDKGVTGPQNVRLLRECEDHGLTVGWNYIYGFPGESDSDYHTVISQLPSLVHLQPPETVGRIDLDRFSPYFERPELGFDERWPADFYSYIYDLPQSKLEDLVYRFDAPPKGIHGTVEQQLREAVGQWRDRYPESTLLMEDEGDGLVVKDRRTGWPNVDQIFRGWQADAYRFLERSRTPGGLSRTMSERDQHPHPGELRSWLDELRTLGLVFENAGRYVALAHRQTPVRITRQATTAGAA